MKTRVHPRSTATIGPLAMTLLVLCLPACSTEGAGTETGGAASSPPAVELTEKPAFPLPAHLESADIAAGKPGHGELFEAGRLLFHTTFNGLDGVGMAKLPNGEAIHRFALTPPGGILLSPASQSCGGCHNLPFPGGGGASHTHVAQDGDLDGLPPFNIRSTTSVFGNGVLQLLAQEMTEDLQAARDDAAAAAREAPGTAVRRELESKGVSYGAISATADAQGEVRFDLSAVEGVDPDLVVRPIGWKGNITTIRGIVMGAASIGMGMQAEEFVWRSPGGEANPDLDADGVTRELSVGDITAMTVYNAALSTPGELGELAEEGYLAAPTAQERAQIERGREVFASVGCATCHVPEMRLENTVFEEPTARGNGHYYDHFLAEKDAGYDPERPARFDVLSEAEAPRARPHPDGGAAVRLYGDLKRHAMGRQLADKGGPTPPLVAEFAPVEHEGEIVFIPPDVFLTPELWGVGNTGPWLHDGRAGTLREAILWHGEDDPAAVGQPGRSEAQESRDAFQALAPEEQDALIALLLSLRSFAPEGST